MLRRHGALNASMSISKAARAADVGGEIHREAERVLELESGLAVEAIRVLCQSALEDGHARSEGLGETLLFLLSVAVTRSFAFVSSG